MSLIPGFEYALAAKEGRRWHIRREDADTMLCGAQVRAVFLASQPERPLNVHDVCLNVLFGKPPVRPRVQRATCPACEGAAPVEGGRIQAHGEFRRQGTEVVESTTSCAGVNMRVGDAR